ncbi:MAG: hypothetical protein QGH31_00220 [Kiritimatiellia bacterium]|nr:hypothetical protein [Kiritimatiellia bacterium]
MTSTAKTDLKEGNYIMRTSYGLRSLILAVIGLSFVIMAGAADVDTPAVPLTTTSTDGATITADGETTVIAFAARPGGVGGSTAVAEAEAGLSAFVGDYAQDGVSAVVFEIQSVEGIDPLDFIVQLFSDGEYHPWVAPRDITAAAGEWERMTVAFNRTEQTWSKVGGTDEAFNVSLNAVNTIGLLFRPSGTLAQTYKIRNFMLVTSLGKVLFGPYGATTTAAVGDQGSGDADEDGMTDLEEDLVGTDKTQASSIFKAEVLGTTDDGVVVKWASAQDYATYDVYRTADLIAGFGEEPDVQVTLAQVTVTEAGESVWEDDSVDPAAGPYYYKVVCVIP